MLEGKRTIIASAVAAVASLAAIFDVTVDQDAVVNGIVAVGGTLAAIYYRWIAKTKVDGKPLDKDEHEQV